jgi:hypothetical protein
MAALNRAQVMSHLFRQTAAALGRIDIGQGRPGVFRLAVETWWRSALSEQFNEKTSLVIA